VRFASNSGRSFGVPKASARSERPAPAPQAVRAASRVNIRMLGMAYTGSEVGAWLVWRRYDVCKTFAASLKTALESQLEPFSPICK
jgi:hypothetical protein